MSDFDKYIDALVRNERPDDTYPKNESSWEELFEFGRRRIFEIVVLKRELTELRAERDEARAVVEAAREYVDLNLSDEYCPNCLHRISDGHDNGCELAELAAALEVTK